MSKVQYTVYTLVVACDGLLLPCRPLLFSMHVWVIGARYLFRALYFLSQLLCMLTFPVQAKTIRIPTGGHQICIAVPTETV